MANWTTEWITHPDYPGWRKRRLVDPRSGMQAMLQTFWERIPGADPTLPGPPGAEGWGGLFPRDKLPERKRRIGENFLSGFLNYHIGHLLGRMKCPVFPADHRVHPDGIIYQND